MSAAQEMGKYGITVNVVLLAAAMKDDFLPTQDVIATLGSEVVLAVSQLSA